MGFEIDIGRSPLSVVARREGEGWELKDLGAIETVRISELSKIGGLGLNILRVEMAALFIISLVILVIVVEGVIGIILAVLETPLSQPIKLPRSL